MNFFVAFDITQKFKYYLSSREIGRMSEVGGRQLQLKVLRHGDICSLIERFIK